MIDFGRFLDSYARKARLYPALITLLPALATAITFIPAIATSAVASTGATIAVSCGLVFLLAEFARSAGKRLEPKLLAIWGGWPTTLWLRHDTDYLPPMTKDRYHRFLASRVSGLTIPDAAQEAAEPVHADHTYRSATQWLMEQCRGSDFDMVHKENAGYGFRRNLMGLRSVGLAIAWGCVAILSLAIGSQTISLGPVAIGKVDQVPLGIAAAWLFCLVCAVAWHRVSERWVRAAADTYSRALLACCDRL